MITVVAGKSAKRVPGHLSVIVAVIVHKPRRHHQAVGIDNPLGVAAEAAAFHYFPGLYADIPVERWHTRAVNYPTVLNEQVIFHGISPYFNL
jgi:hypothetical protein